MRLGLEAAVGHDECAQSPQEDPIGYHRLGYAHASSARIKRHDEMVGKVAKTAIQADPNSFSIAREERLPDHTEAQARPGDVSLNFGDGRTYADLTLVSPFSAACLNASRLAGCLR